MKIILELAWRSIWRNKRRTILTVLAIVFATFLTIMRNGIAKGTFNANLRFIIKSYSGALQIQKPEYSRNPSLNQCFRYDENIKSILKQNSEIISYTARTETNGLISFKNNSLGAIIIGIDPNKEKNVTTLLDRVTGKFFDSDTSNEIVVGSKLLNNLGAKINDKIVLLSQCYDATLGNKIFTICGTVKTGNEFDEAGIFIPLKTSQEFLGMDNKINTIVLSVKDINNIEHTKSNLTKFLNPLKLKVLSWDEILWDLKQYMDYDDIKDNIFMGILVFIVAFGILNTILMSVTERFREFGIALSIGMPQSKLVIQVFFESLFIMIIGLLVGNLVGGSINYYVYLYPIHLSGDFASIYEQFGFIPKVESSMDLGIFISTSSVIFVIFLLVTIYPLVKVYKLKPLKGIRYT